MATPPAISRSIAVLAVGFAFIGSLPAAPATHPAAVATPAAAKKEESQWVFSLLPKSLQKNPRLELTVITEMTEEGKKLPAVSPGSPAYFDTFSAGYHAMGELSANENPVAEAEIRKLLISSLAMSGYLPEKPPAHPATLMIIFSWGTHNLLVDLDEENSTLDPTAVARNLLDRAALVGGTKFSERLKQLFREANDLATANYTPPADPTGTVPAMPSPIPPQMMEFMNPVERFKRESTRNDFLVDQAASDVYYVVASAYDLSAMKAKHRVLLWRTRMTVASAGVSQEQSLPTMVYAAGPFFGKDMTDAEIIHRKVIPDGTVEIGVPRVVEPEETPAKTGK